MLRDPVHTERPSPRDESRIEASRDRLAPRFQNPPRPFSLESTRLHLSPTRPPLATLPLAPLLLTRERDIRPETPRSPRYATRRTRRHGIGTPRDASLSPPARSPATPLARAACPQTCLARLALPVRVLAFTCGSGQGQGLVSPGSLLVLAYSAARGPDCLSALLDSRQELKWHRRHGRHLSSGAEARRSFEALGQ